MSNGLFDPAAFCVIAAVFLATLASPWVRHLYRQQVVRLMRFDQVLARPPGWWTPARGTADATHCARSAPGADADELAVLTCNSETRIARATGAAWLTFVMMALAVAQGVDAGTGVSGRVGFALAAGLLALGPALMNLPPRWSRRALPIGFVACLLAWPVMRVVQADYDADTDPLPPWQVGLGALAMSGAYLAMFHRTLRGQVLPLTVTALVTILLTLFSLGLLEQHVGSCVADIGKAEQSAPFKIAHSTLRLTVMLLSLWFGLRALGGLARLVERGWISELSMGSAISLWIVAMTLVFIEIPDAADGRSAWLAWLPWLWTAVPLGVYGALLRGQAAGTPGPQLLVLRVFAEDTRRHSMLDAVQSRWRYVGPVHQIGGPDLVAMNTGPYECAMFLAQRLHELFVPQAPSAAQLQTRLRTRLDHEGRYSINEVFCFNSAWRTVVEQLMQSSDAVVLDVRGLTPRREGTAFEISLLARAALLPRVVAVGDGTTDWSHIDHLVCTEGQEPQHLQRLNMSTDDVADDLFARLLQVTSRRGLSGGIGPLPGGEFGRGE